MSEKIWIVDDDQSIRWVLQRALEKARMTVRAFEHPRDLLYALQSVSPEEQPEAIITDIRMPDMDGFELLKKIQENHPELPVIIMTAHSDMDSAVSAYESGAFEYLPKPFDINEAIALAKRACEVTHDNQQRRSEQSTSEQKETRSEITQQEIIGKSVAMQEMFRTIGRLSKTSLSVLVTGESGTGKELVAKALHTHSPRADQPFIAINTAAIPRDLLESELFGHEKGAFTGAQAQRKGRFEQANGGTLFLDEIGDMPAELQTRLLRVLADGEFYRVGGTRPVKVDVRVVAATHQDLEKHVRAGTFREDLYHRLNVIRVHIPALRERGDDILILLDHFLLQAAEELQLEPKKLNAEVRKYLLKLAWPGNVRQLENISRWLMVMASGREITLDDLPPDLRKQSESGDSGSHDWQKLLSEHIRQRLIKGETRILDELTPEFERIAMSAAMQQTGGRKKDAADLLGWGRNTLTRKLKELDESPNGKQEEYPGER
jgi:two-component system nitrogen regulation response regulator GlnG